MLLFGNPLRRRFLLERGTAFLNHGSFGATPRTVLAAAARWRARMEANPDRFLRYVLPDALRAAAGHLARFLHAREQDVVFVENATSGVNAVLRSLEFRPGDEILANTHTYNAVRQTIREVCRRTGAKLVEAHIELPVKNPEELFSPIAEKLSRRTKLVVLDHISSPTGLIFPVQRLAAAARACGARVLVDGAHAPGQIALDIPSLGVDWYAGNCHKWLFAPKGCGFLWSRRGAQAGIHPPVISHGYAKGYAAEFDWTGTRDFSGWLSVPDGIAFMKQLNASKVRAYNHHLATGQAKRIAAAWGMPLDAPTALHGSLAAIRLPDVLQRRDPRQLMAELLAKRRVVVPFMQVDGVLWARVSAQVYNVPADYDKLLNLYRP
ncbi:MAG: aminotransferase class V-fold PLP-dependent enzyme [Betaproteobacteria bacterium]